MAHNLPNQPSSSPMVEPNAPTPRFPLLYLTKLWDAWFLQFWQRINAIAYRVASVSVEHKAASIASTNLVPLPAGGMYRIAWRFRLQQAASVSSSLALSITSSDGGVSCVLATAAYTGNAVNAPVAGELVIRSDAAAPIVYDTTYGSVGGTPMQYRLDLVCEEL